jgi:hypothetical protein
MRSVWDWFILGLLNDAEIMGVGWMQMGIRQEAVVTHFNIQLHDFRGGTEEAHEE